MVIPNRKRILLVDDYDDTRDLATLTLTECELICARNFDEGLRLAQQQDFDLYIYLNANKEAFTKDGRFAITSPPAHASKERG